ncbi:hypothetical protein G4B88_008778 [Cannabis sativa]|uniref:Plastocyanin-like domain-containing protein n=1 Tax=Cannabis sativa TaxID=3483 RepID=A0A7J6GCU3_CANSA|nr:hypothetical protein G4B88_008778 [Cannabis sativa]
MDVLRQPQFTGALNVSDVYTMNGQHASESEVKSSTKTTTAYLQYKATSCKKGKPAPRPILPQLPAFNDTITTRAFTNGLRSLLKAGILGVFANEFPYFDYTSNVSQGLWQPSTGTKLYKLKYDYNVQIVLHDTSIVTAEDHPMHLHGYHFYIIGSGFSLINPQSDPARSTSLTHHRRISLELL